jgi:hypothetical protein
LGACDFLLSFIMMTPDQKKIYGDISESPKYRPNTCLRKKGQ